MPEETKGFGLRQTVTRSHWLNGRGLVGVAVIAVLVLVFLFSFGGGDNASAANVFTTVDQPGGNTAMVKDGSGNPVIAYAQLTVVNNQFVELMRVAHCSNTDCSAKTLNTVDTDIGSAVFVSIGLDNSGNPVVAYSYSNSGGTIISLRVAHCGDANCSTVSTTVDLDNTGFSGNAWYNSMAMDSSGNPVIAYRRASFDINGNHDDLGTVHCGNSGCTSGNTFAVPEAGPSGGATASRTAIVLDGSANPVVTYGVITATSVQNLHVLHCGNANCTSGNVINDPTNGLTVSGGATGVRLDGSGFPIIAATVSGSLGLIHCNDVNCDPAVNGPETINFPYGACCQALQLGLEPGTGNPEIAAFAFNVGIVYFRCLDVNCATRNGVIVDQGGGGEGMGFRVDALGNPMIAYPQTVIVNQAPLSSEILLHCDNPDCATAVNTPTPTNTPAGVPTATMTPSPTATISAQPTNTPTRTPVLGGATSTSTPTVTPTSTAQALATLPPTPIIVHVPTGSGVLGGVLSELGRPTPVVAAGLQPVQVVPSVVISPPNTGDGGLR